MAKDMNLTAQEIYEKEFHVDLKGYAPAEVDEFLDMVIEDYHGSLTPLFTIDLKHSA